MFLKDLLLFSFITVSFVVFIRFVEHATEFFQNLSHLFSLEDLKKKKSKIDNSAGNSTKNS